jgi:pimeloyl-ACP methyl ester carboxylesterase
MGTSDKPPGGYDKKTMAKDVRALMQTLGHSRAHVVGHDIGAQVAYSFAANYPDATRTLTLLDVAHPDAGSRPGRCSAHGTFSDKIDAAHAYPWWFAFPPGEGSA